MAVTRETGGASTRIIQMVLVLAFCTLWRLPSLAEPPWVNDEGTYATVGHIIGSGRGLLYRDVWENKPPAIYVVYAGVERLAGQSHLLLGVRLAACVAALAFPLLAYGLMRRLGFGHGRALLALLLGGMAVDVPLLEGTTANAETFMAPLALAGVALSWLPSPRPRAPQRSVPAHASPAPMPRRRERNSRLLPLAGGLCLGVALLFKAVALADVVAAVILTLSFSPAQVSRRPVGAWSQRAWRAALVAAGAILPPLLTVAAFAVHGTAALGALWWATVAYNLAYVGAGGGGTRIHLIGMVLLLVLAALLARWSLVGRMPAILDRRRGTTATPAWDWRHSGLSLWGCWAAVGVLAGGRPHVHYVLQLVAPCACLAAALWRPRQENPGPRLAVVAAGLGTVALVLGTVVAAAGGPAVVARTHRQAAYYAGVWWVATGQQTPRDFGADLDPRVGTNLALASAVHQLARSPRCPSTLLVWGNAPWIYFLSGLPPATPFTSADYSPPPPGETALMTRTVATGSAGTVVLIDVSHNGARAAILTARYALVARIGGAGLYASRRCGTGAAR